LALVETSKKCVIHDSIRNFGCTNFVSKDHNDVPSLTKGPLERVAIVGIVGHDLVQLISTLSEAFGVTTCLSVMEMVTLVGWTGATMTGEVAWAVVERNDLLAITIARPGLGNQKSVVYDGEIIFVLGEGNIKTATVLTELINRWICESNRMSIFFVEQFGRS